MKKNISRFIAILLGLQLGTACTPEDYTYTNNEIVDPTTIDSVALIPNQHMLIADGYAQLDLRPVLFNKQRFRIPDSRIQEEWLEYITPSGQPISRHFSTSEASLIGQTITTQVRVKGTDIISQPVSFQIVAPLEEKYMTPITIPVIFHVIQTTEDIESYGGPYSQEKIELLLQKLNHLFEGSASVNPVGVNTHIHFKMAEYDPDGQKMINPGLNRATITTLDAGNIENNFENFLVDHHLIWPADKYMNIWLISDRKNLVADFANQVSTSCRPQYVYPGTSVQERPKGIDWQELPAGITLTAHETGIIYKLQELDVITRSFTNNSGSASACNELAYYVGGYLGLLPTCTFDKQETGTDYCEDTIDYWGKDAGSTIRNNTWYKEEENYYFRSENIMDDPTGLHTSISKNQCERIRWVLENCPERAAWKSNFAFTGQ